MSIRGSGAGNRNARSGRPAMAVIAAALMAGGCMAAQMDMVQDVPPGFSPGFPQPVPPPAPARVFIYPDRGQSPQQQEFDKGQCYSWAVQQSGFDPANPQVSAAPPPMPGAPQGGLFRGAAGGAALGAVGGAIGGNAGEGAAIGAGVGALFGAMRRARWMEEQQQQQQSYVAQQQSALAQGHAAYNRAFGVCMSGRGYTVS